MTASSFSLKSCITEAITKIASGVVRTMIDGRCDGVKIVPENGRGCQYCGV